MMNVATNVVVAHPETGKVITIFTKADKATGEERTFGRVRLDSESFTVSNGFTSVRKRTAFVVLDSQVLPLIAPHIQAGQPYPIAGKIVVKETLAPQYEGHVPKMDPSTNEYVRVHGMLVYRITEFTTDLNQRDILVNSANTMPNEEA
jgi:hypothetical protein